MALDVSLSRKEVLTSLIVGLSTAALPAAALGQGTPPVPAPQGTEPVKVDPNLVTLDDLKAVAKISGLTFTDEELKEVLDSVRSDREAYAHVRAMPIKETTSVPLAFVPNGGGTRVGSRVEAKASPTKGFTRPSRDEDVAFLSIRELGHLLRTRQITSVELTRIYLSRLKQYGDALQCVVTLTEDLAISQAEEADRELRTRTDRGPLHGIPYGAKDLFATKGILTTWGADPYATQVPNYDAAAIERLRAAGAVLVAKTSLGSLAMGDVWHKGVTKNPWNPKQGSSGSSAGSASATAAGLIAFGIGTETSGSIMSPSLRCRVTGLRPSFGRVSRFGAMELSYSLDKVGPLCREAEDCALVLAALCGADPRDPSAVDRPFEYPAKVDLKKVKVGWAGPADRMADDPAVKRLRDLGVAVEAIKLTPFPNELYAILNVEAGSAFDAFTRTDLIHQLKNSSWPQTFRGSRFVPGVEYLQAMRARTIAQQKFEQEFGDFDAILGTGIGGTAFAHANFGGYPSILIPMGDDGSGNSVGRALIGRLYGEDRLIVLAKALQDGFDYHHRRPSLSP
ncbi:amidase [Fimbriimonas ginsengisoli]|uniref:Amidase n=1 Tax=Fimbriimonas ginsengisoli Gsoil 348 TaxID=661478 RepID=A0A068NSC1_FIMGI|nr:amidase [Fimbriimonas ginsengisoli]AIE86341.1 Amidase [Fimbriimonas ginsengisoli Gsoil 348]